MDLNIIFDNCGIKNENVFETFKMALELGYGTIALNTIIDASNLEGKNNKIPEPIDTSTYSSVTKVYSRLTAIVTETIHCHHLFQNPLTKKYDIIALQPIGEKMLQHVCGLADVDIISLDFSGKLSFSLKRSYLRQAADKGVVFEIQYAPCLRDQSARRNNIANSQVLVDISKGNNVIISSGAEKTMELRGVHDIINVATLFGLNESKAEAAVCKNGQKVLHHSFTRQETGCGFVSVHNVAQVKPWIVNACVVPKKRA